LKLSTAEEKQKTEKGSESVIKNVEDGQIIKRRKLGGEAENLDFNTQSSNDSAMT
jgi:hypothetical protein